MKYLHILLLCIACVVDTNVSAQTLPANQPEQDACNALEMCGTSFFFPYSYFGNGQVSDLLHTPCDAPGMDCGEANCVWIKLVINTSGVLVFTIDPVVNTDDYDFAVVNATNINCNNIQSSDVIRCNFNNNQPVANNGITGLSPNVNFTGVQGGTTGQPYVKSIDAVAGEVYLIMINNAGGNGQGGNLGSGFTLNFTGSTATFNNTGNPTLESIVTPPCNNKNKITVQLSKQVKCGSLATNGSDFIISPLGIIASANGINCSGANGYTDKIELNFAQPLPPGNYVLHAKLGTDNNTLLDLCNNPLMLPDSLPFTVPDLMDTVYMNKCPAQLPFVWNGINVTQGGSAAAVFHFTTPSGCDSVTVLNLTVSNIITATENLTKCSEDLPFVWNGKVITQGGNAVAKDTTANIVGCDSVTTLNVIVIPPIITSDNITICTNQLPYSWNGIAINIGGDSVVSTILNSWQGCDSLVYLNLTVTPIKTNSVTKEICANELPIIWNGVTIPSGTQSVDSGFVFYTQTPTGCDSNVYLNLIVHPYNPVTSAKDTFACGHFDFNDKEYTQDTVLIDTIMNQYGCDSVYMVMNITVYINEPQPLSVEANGCDSILFEGKTYFSDTTLTNMYKDIHGCDSVFRTVYVKVEDFQLSLLASADTIAQGEYLSLSTSANYDYNVMSWQPNYLFTNQNAKEQVFKPDVTHNYIVIAQSDIGCLDTASKTVVVDTLIPDFLMPNAFSPNGDGINDLFAPVIYNKSGYTINFFRVFNRWGNEVYNAMGTRKAGWDGSYGNSGKIANADVYNYIIQVQFVDGKIVTKKGDVTLVR